MVLAHTYPPLIETIAPSTVIYLVPTRACRLAAVPIVYALCSRQGARDTESAHASIPNMTDFPVWSRGQQPLLPMVLGPTPRRRPSARAMGQTRMGYMPDMCLIVSFLGL